MNENKPIHWSEHEPRLQLKGRVHPKMLLDEGFTITRQNRTKKPYSETTTHYDKDFVVEKLREVVTPLGQLKDKSIPLQILRDILTEVFTEAEVNEVFGVNEGLVQNDFVTEFIEFTDTFEKRNEVNLTTRNSTNYVRFKEFVLRNKGIE